MEDLRSKRGGGVCGPPPDPGKGVEGGSADVAGRWEGGRIGKWMGACWFLESTQNNGGAPSSRGGGLVISSSSSLQLRVDVFKIRSR